MGVKFVTPKNGDSVAVVARSVEKAVDEDEIEGAEGVVDAEGVEPVVSDATIDAAGSEEPADDQAAGLDADGEDES